MQHFLVSIFIYNHKSKSLQKCDFSCSLNCYKSHKESQCQDQKEKNEGNIQTFYEDKLPDHLMVYETQDTLPVEKLEKLKDSEELKSLLANPHLRNFLIEINGATKPWNAMKLAMMEPLFLEFADVSLKIVQENPKDGNSDS